jgi:hypothetical protein
MKSTGCAIASKLMEHNEENIVHSFNDLNSNELEYLCTNSIGSHFIQDSLISLNKRKDFENFNKLFDKLKVIFKRMNIQEF